MSDIKKAPHSFYSLDEIDSDSDIESAISDEVGDAGVISIIESTINGLDEKLFIKETSSVNTATYTAAEDTSNHCTTSDLLSFVFFLLLLLSVDRAVAPDSFLCGYLSILFTCLFMVMRRYSNSRAFTLISIVNGFGVATIGIHNVLDFNAEVIELFEQGVLSKEQFDFVELKLSFSFAGHLTLMAAFTSLLAVEFWFQNHEDMLLKLREVGDISQMV